uniref:Uncharacterized protein n=1 Tax=Rhizophora mucronata TaxID=61149 RepID=A0A2P2Q4W5_RHIMU
MLSQEPLHKKDQLVTGSQALSLILRNVKGHDEF